MPLRVRRKTCGMEKVENLYRTARAQNAVPHIGVTWSRFVIGTLQAFAISNRCKMVRYRLRIDLGAIDRGTAASQRLTIRLAHAAGIGPGSGHERASARPAFGRLQRLPDLSHFDADFFQLLRFLRLPR